MKKRHKWAKIRAGLYNYRAYNVRKFPNGWAIRDEDGKPCHKPCKTLRSVTRVIDSYYRTQSAG